jgi:hypothetical protein
MMKKALLSTAILGAIFFASCKKDYTCTCTAKDNQGNNLGTSSVTIHTTKKKAQDACNSQASSSYGGTTVTETCTVQ